MLARIFKLISMLPLPYSIKITLIGLSEALRNTATYLFRTNKAPIKRIQHPKLVVITGGNKGIGREATLLFIKSGYHVHILARDSNSCIEVQQLCHRIAPNSCLYTLVDLSSPKSIKGVSGVFKDTKIDILVANAGVYEQQYVTKHNLEYNFLVNHLGHFALVKSLLGNLKGGRVVCVSSSALYSVRSLSIKKKGGFMEKYAESKLCNALMSLYLKNKMGVESVSVHPGVICTDLFSRSFYGMFVVFMKRIVPFVFYSAKEGAGCVLKAALCKNLKGVDEIDLFVNDEVGIAPSYVNLRNSERLWEYSERLCSDLKM